MDDPEIPLAGGTLNKVVRVGATIRRPTGPWTPTVHALLDHLRQAGFDLAPQALGYDEQGREILSYLPGETVGGALPWPDWARDESVLIQMGRAAADFHRAVAGFRPEGVVAWHTGRAELADDQIVCHHDLAPYNVVVADGSLRGIIDWDLIGPGTPLSDLAFVAWQWVPLHDPLVAGYFGWTHPDRVRRTRVLLDSYGLEDREGFVDAVIARIGRNRDIMIDRAAGGDVAYARLQEQGHVIGMNRAIEFLGEIGEDLQNRIG